MADRADRQPAHRQERTRHRAGREGSTPTCPIAERRRRAASSSATPGAIDRLARLNAIRFEPARGRGDADRRGRCEHRRPARRRDRHRRRKGPPRKGARSGRAEGSQVARRAARPTPPSSKRPSPRRSKRPAPTMRTTPPRPNGWRRRWRGWGERLPPTPRWMA
jgi:hypothetical protein